MCTFAFLPELLIMRRLTLLVFLLTVLGCLTSAEPFRTRIFAPNLKTLQAGIEGEKYSLPIINLGGNEVLTVRFDEMSHESRSFSYRLLHCNADWTPSDLNSTEFLDGFTRGDITHFELSANTSYHYTHYRFQVPNDEMKLKISGNYIIQIFEDNRPDQPSAQVCFSVVEPKVAIEAGIRPDTDLEINGRYQQLDLAVNLSGYYVREPMNEIKVTVRQNNRTDNQVEGVFPKSLAGNRLIYNNHRSLIFEAGSEFRSFDFSSAYAAGRGIDEITLNNQQFEVWLTPDKLRRGAYEFDFDVNGRFIIHNQEAFYNANIEADYMPVHFRLATAQPFFDGLLYLGGEMTYNIQDQSTRMNYNNSTQQYQQTLLLKQGGYNYQYRFVAKGGKAASVQRTEGSYWQTRNEYTVYVYHRPWGERYDKLVGVRTVTNNGME